MSAKVTIETSDMTISRESNYEIRNCVDEAWVVQLIVSLVDALDAANTYRNYSMRTHLLRELQK